MLIKHVGSLAHPLHCVAVGLQVNLTTSSDKSPHFSVIQPLRRVVVEPPRQVCCVLLNPQLVKARLPLWECRNPFWRCLNVAGSREFLFNYITPPIISTLQI